MGLRRIQKEAKDLEALMRPTVDAVVFSRQVLSVAVDPEDPFHWTVTVVPTVDTCMSEALFGVEVALCVRFPQDYPLKPFAVTFDDAWLEGVRKGQGVHGVAVTQQRCVDSDAVFTWRGVQPYVAGMMAWMCIVVVVVSEWLLKSLFRAAHLLAIPAIVFGIVHHPALGYALIPPMLNVVADWCTCYVKHRRSGATISAAKYHDTAGFTQVAIQLREGRPCPEPGADAATPLQEKEVTSAAAAISLSVVASPAGAPEVPSAPAPAVRIGPNDPMRLTVKTLIGRSLTIEHLKPSSTTDELRLAVLERELMPLVLMGLIHGGRLMEDGHTLADYGVRPDATIHLIVRVRGCQSSLFGADGVLKSDWSPVFTICTLLRTLIQSLFAAVPPVCGGSSCRCHLRPLADTHATLDLVQWAGRCSSPARGVVWSPSNDARWPLLFRKIVRYVRRIAVRAESHATRRTLPLDVVERIASYL